MPLADVMLAIAVAAAERDPRFAERLGTRMRELLVASAAEPELVEPALAWLERFEASTCSTLSQT